MPSNLKRALVIEDNAVDRLLMVKILQGLGYATVEAKDGREGIESVSKLGPFQLITVDQNMQSLDGLGFLKSNVALAGNVKPKIVMVSGDTELNKIRSALSAGADEYLMKPYSRESVQLKLKMLSLE